MPSLTPLRLVVCPALVLLLAACGGGGAKTEAGAGASGCPSAAAEHAAGVEAPAEKTSAEKTSGEKSSSEKASDGHGAGETAAGETAAAAVPSEGASASTGRRIANVPGGVPRPAPKRDEREPDTLTEEQAALVARLHAAEQALGDAAGDAPTGGHTEPERASRSGSGRSEVPLTLVPAAAAPSGGPAAGSDAAPAEGPAAAHEPAPADAEATAAPSQSGHAEAAPEGGGPEASAPPCAPAAAAAGDHGEAGDTTGKADATKAPGKESGH